MEHSSLRAVAFCALLLGFCGGPCHAITFSEALVLAQINDPSYRGALASLEGARARSDQAFGQLLPQVSATASANRTHRNYTSVDPLFEFDTGADISNYNGYSGQLNLTQPLWRHANIIGNRQAGFVATQSEYEVWVAEQDMLVRFTQAWADLMLAHDAVIAAEQSVKSMRSLLNQAEAAKRIDLIAAAKLEEARSKYERALADKITAESSELSSRAALEEIVGPLNDFTPPTLGDSYTFPPLQEAQFDWWRSRIDMSPMIASSKQALLAAEAEIRKQRAGHEPSLDLVGSYGRNYQAKGNIPSQSGYDSRQSSVGLQLTVPFYSGGVISAKVQEAIALRNKARQDLSAAERKANTALVTAWYGMRSGDAHYKAASQEIQSAAVALQTAKGGAAKGLKFELDIAEAQEQYAQAWYEAQKARYGILTSWIKLKATLGQVTQNDFSILNRYMTEQPTLPWLVIQPMASAE